MGSSACRSPKRREGLHVLLALAELDILRETGDVGVSDGAAVDKVEEEEQRDLREDDKVELAQEPLLSLRVDLGAIVSGL